MGRNLLPLGARDWPDIELRLLGAPAWRSVRGSDWRALTSLDAALLCALALEGDQRRDALAALLSHGSEQEQANNSLRQRVLRLRRTCCGNPLMDFGTTLHLHVDVKVDIADPAAYWSSEQLLATVDFERDQSKLSRRLHAWRDDWRQRRRAGLARLAHLEAAQGDVRAAAVAMQRLHDEDPADEACARALMSWQAHLGEQPAALRTFSKCQRAVLASGRKGERETSELAGNIERSPVAVPATPQPPALARLPPFVGRSEELQSMAAAWEQLRPFVLVGDAGAGKSRLLDEFLGGRDDVIRVSAALDDQASSHGTTLRWLPECVSRFGEPDDRRHRSELSRLMPDRGKKPSAPGSAAFLQLAISASLERAVAGGLRAFVLDNAHVADDPSFQALRHAAEALPSLMFAFALRTPAPDEPRWRTLMESGARLLPIYVRGLDNEQIAHLLRRLALPGIDDPVSAGTALERHCGGNPYFVLETLRDLSRTGRRSDELPVPASVEALLLQRLRQLPALALELARAAAIAGTDFNVDLALEVTAATREHLDAAWQDLEAAHVFKAHTFAHDIVFETVRRSIPDPVRRRLHAAVAGCLVRGHASSERAAHHHAQAGEWAQAAEAMEQAALDALLVGHDATVTSRFDQAAGWFRNAGLTHRAHQAGVRSLIPCLMREGPAAAAARCDKLFAAAVDPAERADVEARRARVSLWSGDTAEAERAACAALVCCTASPETRTLAQAALAVARGWSGRSAEALASLEQAIATVDEIADAASRQGLLSAYGYVLSSDERWRDCKPVLDKALQLAQQIGDAVAEADAMTNLGAACSGLGRAGEAAEWAGHAARLYAVLGSPLGRLANELNRATFLTSNGEFAAAVELLKQVSALAVAQPELLLHSFMADYGLAEIWLALGCPDRAAPLLVADPPPQPPSLRLVCNELRARAAQAAGRERADVSWQVALAAVENAAGHYPARRLRTRLNGVRTMTLPKALSTCEDALAEAQFRGSPGIELLALMRRAQVLSGAERFKDALPDTESALVLMKRVRHLFVPPAELLWTASQVLDAVGRREAAVRCRAQAADWLFERAEHHVPPDCRQAFLQEHPVHRAVLRGLAHPLA